MASVKSLRSTAAVAVAVSALAIAGGAYASSHQAYHENENSVQRTLQPGDSGYFAPGFTAAGTPTGR